MTPPAPIDIGPIDIPPIDVGPIDVGPIPNLNLPALPGPSPIGLTYTTDLGAVLAGFVPAIGSAVQTGEEILSGLLDQPSKLGQAIVDSDFARLMAGDVGAVAETIATEPEAALAINPLTALLAGFFLPSATSSSDTTIDPAAGPFASVFPVPELPPFELPPPPEFTLPPELTIFGDRPAPTRALPPPPLDFPPIGGGPIPNPLAIGPVGRPAPRLQPGPRFSGGTLRPSPAPFLQPLPSTPRPSPAPTISIAPQPMPLPRAAAGPGSLAGGSPLTGFQSTPVPSRGSSPGLATLTMGSCSCTQDEAATKRKQKYGCRQGYFRETSGGITYKTWSTRKCPSSKTKPPSRQRARPITS